jgi:hypothetical protein
VRVHRLGDPSELIVNISNLKLCRNKFDENCQGSVCQLFSFAQRDDWMAYRINLEAVRVWTCLSVVVRANQSAASRAMVPTEHWGGTPGVGSAWGGFATGLGGV